MYRKAILIESSRVKEHSELPGARVDIKNWDSYLRSDLGGAWSDSEILKLSHPWSSDLEGELKAVAGYDYVLVAFSGHGCDGSIVLNDSLTAYNIDNLKPKSAKGTLIVDSCRGVSDDISYANRTKRAFANVALDEAFAVNALSGKATSLLSESLRDAPARHRNAWELSLMKSSRGVVTMHSCSKGEAAEEDPDAGGFYTSLLLQGATIWSHEETGIYSTKDAHDYANRMLPPQQTPEYSPSHLSFPLGVSV